MIQNKNNISGKNNNYNCINVVGYENPITVHLIVVCALVHCSLLRANQKHL